MKNIILYGSWQTKNIGDIAHTPGFLSLAKEFLPEEEYSITLWPCALDRGVREMLLKNFPFLEFGHLNPHQNHLYLLGLHLSKVRI